MCRSCLSSKQLADMFVSHTRSTSSSLFSISKKQIQAFLSKRLFFSSKKAVNFISSFFFVSAVQLLTKNALFSSGSRRFDKLDANPQIWQRDGEGGGGGRKKNTSVLQTMASTQTITLLRYEWSA